MHPEINAHKNLVKREIGIYTLEAMVQGDVSQIFGDPSLQVIPRRHETVQTLLPSAFAGQSHYVAFLALEKGLGVDLVVICRLNNG